MAHLKDIADEKAIVQLIAVVHPVDPDAEFGGSEERKRLERKLVRKLDFRMSILVLIFILNYVRVKSLEVERLAYEPPTDRQEQCYVCFPIPFVWTDDLWRL